MLHPYEASDILHVLLHDLRTATIFREDDAAYADAGDFAWRRAEWRIRDGIADATQTDDALRILRCIIELGMQLCRGIDWRNRNSPLLSMIASQTGVDLAV